MGENSLEIEARHAKFFLIGRKLFIVSITELFRGGKGLKGRLIRREPLQSTNSEEKALHTIRCHQI
jgi:hypothetical protein